MSTAPQLPESVKLVDDLPVIPGVSIKVDNATMCWIPWATQKDADDMAAIYRDINPDAYVLVEWRGDPMPDVESVRRDAELYRLWFAESGL